MRLHAVLRQNRQLCNVLQYVMGRPRTFADADPAARMRRSRAALAARGGRLVQIKLDPDARRAVAALELTLGDESLAAIAAHAFAEMAARNHFPLRLSRDQEVQLARLATGPCTAAAFRKTEWADAFLAGLAIALATDRRLPRAELLALARKLSPETMNIEGYRRWLDASPIRLQRLFKLVDTELGIARAKAPA
jgi:hypothetical protein